MRSGPEIPPWVAIVVIVLVVAVAGALIWRGSGKKTMSADQQAQMRKIMAERGMGLNANRGAQTNQRWGASSQAMTPQQSPR